MTLTETARTTRMFARYGGIALGALVAIRVVFIIYGLTIPKPSGNTGTQVAVIDPKYGQIHPLDIELAHINLTTNYTISLDLIKGQLPNEPVIAYIYPVLKAPYGFLSIDRARNLAKTFGFRADPIKISVTDNLWTGFNESLQVNEQTLNFKYQYNYTADPSIFNAGIFTSQAQIKQLAETQYTRHAVLPGTPNDILVSSPDISLVQYKNQQLQPTQRILDATATRLDYRRRDVQFTLSNRISYTVPFVFPNYVGSNTSVLIAAQGNTGGGRLLEYNFTLWRYLPTQGASYGLITSEAAWLALQQDPVAFTVYLGNLELGPLDRSTAVPLVSNIRVRESFLAYYDSTVAQEFIQPVWVFVGKGTLADGGTLDWVAYVPAIHPNHINNSTQ